MSRGRGWWVEGEGGGGVGNTLLSVVKFTFNMLMLKAVTAVIVTC